MAPTLTSHSFLLTSAPQSRLTLKVFAKRPATSSQLRLGKSSGGGDDSLEASNSNPFAFFNFGDKVPDMKALIPVVGSPSTGLSFGNQRRKDPNTVFVAGATGQAGVRVVQVLLREGFSVRAGVPELAAAQDLARLASSYKIISKEESKRLNAVESTFQDAESIAKAIGNAGKVVVTIGPSENGPTAEVTTSDALQVVEAAQLAGVGHVAIVYDGNATASSSTYNVFDGISSFFGNLFSRSQPLTVAEFLGKVAATDVSYTLIKTNLTEDFSPERSYNVVVSAEGRVDTANDYKVAKSQIASMVADVFSNTAVAENKVVEVSTDPSAPAKPVDELFRAIPEDGRRKAYAEALAKEKAEEEARRATEKAREAAKAAKKLEEEVKKLSEQEAQAATLAEEAQEKAAAAGASVENLLSKAKDLGSGLSWDKLSSQLATAVQKPGGGGGGGGGEKPKVQIATVRGQAKARTLPAKKAVVKPSIPKFGGLKPKARPEGGAEAKTEERSILGGLFKQETIYIEDD
ncbi:protein PLASTID TRANSCRIPTIONALLY ACTIVE 16, chloroplastic [Malania oleifera]|uniref:protein PLASTID TRANSCRIPTIONALLY ACTIVE 16, chloroplastic n=1 Tax=Malania oleifera TaxID=397392 RepID=UPI0025AE55C8|nr:protein PLASTID TRANSCRIPTIONALLY ACTIVE 16, chloroplastic [Malania oleifera]